MCCSGLSLNLSSQGNRNTFHARSVEFSWEKMKNECFVSVALRCTCAVVREVFHLMSVR